MRLKKIFFSLNSTAVQLGYTLSQKNFDFFGTKLPKMLIFRGFGHGENGGGKN